MALIMLFCWIILAMVSATVTLAVLGIISGLTRISMPSVLSCLIQNNQGNRLLAFDVDIV